MIVLAPISVGELYDKITILEIKAARLDEPAKRVNVRRELEALRAVAAREVEAGAAFDRTALDRHVAELREINGALWDIEDGKRAAEDRQVFDDAFVALARQVYLRNDRRAAVKRAISLLVGSAIVEEKSHGGANRGI